MFHHESCTTAIACAGGGVQDGQDQAPSKSASKLLSGEVRYTLKIGQNRKPGSSIAYILQFKFGSTANG